ncbi:MAG: HAMP domain-containing sensor histidine kinase [Cyclobacteriaceae bacterium]
MLAFASVWHFDRAEAVRSVRDKVNNLYSGALLLTKTDVDFLSADITNSRFYTEESSLLLVQRNRLSESVSASIDSLRHSTTGPFGIQQQTAAFQQLYLAYEESFDRLVKALLTRGYKDHGTEGAMRDFAHELENYPTVLPPEYLLTLRRHEKDFLMRGEAAYVFAFNKQADKLLEGLKNGRNRDKAARALENYREAFNELAVMSRKIGMVNKGGLISELHESGMRLGEYLQKVNVEAGYKEKELVDAIRDRFIWMVVLCVLISLVFSHVLSRHILRPLTDLTDSMDKVQERDFDIDSLSMDSPSSSAEVRRLYTAYTGMLERLNKQVQLIKEKNNALAGQNNHLIEANHKLHISENRLKQLNNTKDKFFSIIAHDLKGPMATLTSFLKIFITYEQGLTREEMKGLAERMHESTTSLSVLLENLLEWSRSQMGAIQFRPERLELKDLIEKNVTRHRVRAQEKNVTLVFEEGGEPEVIADRHMLDFIIRNLLSNAVKFTPESGKVTVSARQSGMFVHLVVCDTGIGIPYEDQKMLFEETHHLSSKGTDNEVGTGLGLLLCKEFADFHQAELTVKSKPGAGTTFRLYLPLSIEKVIA